MGMNEGKLYKVLSIEGRPIYGRGEYNLPCNGQPGDWMPSVEGELVQRKNGYHLCTIEQLPCHLGPRIYEAEGQGDCIEYETEIVYRSVRLLLPCKNWNERSARLFACDCAERVLPHFEREYPKDSRPREAIEVARRYANNEATEAELSAAWAAAGAVAGAAARAAAWAAAWDAAGVTAGVTARAAAGAAERRWQSERLAEVLNGG